MCARVQRVIVTHGGAGAPIEDQDGAQAAAALGLAKLDGQGDASKDGSEALTAVLAAAVKLEDDPRFNAGTGSNYRLDGETIEMDAAVMTSDGRSGAVAGLQRVRNPVLVAAEVRARTPHLLIVGEGATQLARRLGFADYDPGTPHARQKLARARALLRDCHADGDVAGWHGLELGAVWNFDRRLEALGCDTIGAVARDRGGGFAAACSTGGTALMLRGRVGDSPLIGCGLYAGADGAVCATGTGEEIVRRFLAKTVYDWLAAGVAAEEACARAVRLFPDRVPVGVIAVGRTTQGTASNREMASALLLA